MHIINFLSTLLLAYWLDLIIVLMLVSVITFLIKKGRKDLAFKIIYGLVSDAEQRFGSKTGQEKYAHVMAQFYGKMPLILRLLYTQEDIELFIETAVKKLKDSLANGDIDLLSYADEKKKP